MVRRLHPLALAAALAAALVLRPAAAQEPPPPPPPSEAPPAAKPGEPAAAPENPAAGQDAPPAEPAKPAPPEVRGAKIARILVDGNRRLTPEAVIHIMVSKEGDPYDEEVLRKDFQRVWERGLLSDLSIEARDDKAGKVVIVRVEEKPIVNDVVYEESKVVGESQIEDALKERKATIEIGEPINYDAVKKAEEAIKGLLGQKGHLDAEVKAVLKDSATAGALDIRFEIEEGPRTRIRKIDFTGNTVFSDGRLKKALKLTKEHGTTTKFSGKDTYHPIKFEQDVREVENLYFDAGYIELEIKPAIVKVVEEKQSDKPGKSRKWVEITQPLDEGKQFKVGKIDVAGNTVFTADQIRRRIPLREGMVLNNSLLQMGLDAIENDYSRLGYFYISTNRVIDRRPNEVADITVRVSEDKPYRIDRIEFGGNTVTRDNVLRREMDINEEDLIDIQRIRNGLRRINQLGYFEIQKEPVIKPIEGTDKVAVTIEGVEQRRSELQVGGGYSGLDGGFFTSSYQTRNFLGRGDLVTFNAQIGGVATRYLISFTEPYFLGKPTILGFSLFRQSTDYVSFTTSSSGGTVTLGKRLRLFHSISTSYALQDTDYDPTVGIGSKTQTSSVRPAYQYDTRNNFLRPSRGLSFGAGVEFAGGPLGGDNYFIKPSVRATKYLKAWKRTFWALHGEAAYVGAFGGRFLPIYERFYLGGERSLRIFPSRTISPYGFSNRFNPAEVYFTKEECLEAKVPRGSHHAPQDPCDRFQIGGNKMVLFNAEFVIPSDSPIDLIFFLDTGNVFTERENVELSEFRSDAGVEVRFFLPVFGAPLRLIYGVNLNPVDGEKERAFVFSIGTTF